MFRTTTGKWTPQVPTERVQVEHNALLVEMLLLSKLEHMLTNREETLEHLKNKLASTNDSTAIKEE